MVATVAAVVLGAVFLTSAITKFAHPAQWRAQAGELVSGAPAQRRGFDAVPVVEAVLGALLVVGWRRMTVAIVAGAVLITFTGLLVIRLLQGRRPPCACFGSLSVRPIGWGSVGRNLVLIAVAGVAALA